MHKAEYLKGGIKTKIIIIKKKSGRNIRGNQIKTSNKTTNNCIFKFSNLESGTISRNVKGTNKTNFPKTFEVTSK